MTGQPDDPAQRDLAWMGYHPRAALPVVATAFVATVLILLGRWYVVDLSELAERVGALAVFALAWAVWPGLALLILYRTVSYTYRLTDRALLVDFGMFARPVPPVPLTEIVAVHTANGWEPALLGTGWVEVRTRDRAVRLLGIRRPSQFAEQVRAAVAAASKGAAN
jgi:uncharacterized membrane protein YdbT with pleckstrin-like domain